MNPNGIYDMGYNCYGKMIFKNPSKAFSQTLIDFPDGFNEIQEEFNLKDIKKNDYTIISAYKNLSWQVNNDIEKDLYNKCMLIGAFLDIYENSFYDMQ